MSFPLSSPLVIATHNQGKLKEISALLAPLEVACISAGSLGLAEPMEDGVTFEENARIKSEAAATASGHAALADDSGLAVEALDGAPGIYSARWAGESKDFSLAMEKLENELRARGVTPEGAAAHFVCALALSAPKQKTLVFTGTIHGRLTFPPRGQKGFGYDPVFIPNGYDMTFAEMEPNAKHAISHRAVAFSKLLAHYGKKPEESAA